MAGGITEKKGAQNSVEMENLAKFAVEEHNKKENGMLELKKVAKVKQQMVSGMMYYITLQATRGSENNSENYYEAKIWVKPWLNFKELVDFKSLSTAPQK